MSSSSTDLREFQNLFGPAVPAHFDFTPLFENSLLSIVPSTVLFCILPFRLRSLRKKSRKVSKSLLHSNKLIFLAVFTGFQAAVLVLYAVSSSVRDSTALAAAALVLADAVGLCFLSHAEHIHTLRPSTIINSYLFLTLLFDVARTRTLWIENAPIPLAGVVTATTVVKLGVTVLEAIEKRSILLSPYRDISPEATSGIYSRSVFWWLNNFMRMGHRRVVKDTDLFPIDSDMSSVVLSDRAQSSWDSANKTGSHALFWSTLKATRYQMALCIFPRLCVIGFRFAQPFLISRTVNFVDSTTESDNIGWGLTAAFVVVFVGKAVSGALYYHMTYRFITSVRGSLVGMIYRKTINLSVFSLNESAAITLMSNDAEGITDAFQNIHELWAVPIELGIATWLLQRQLGLTFLAPAGVALISIISIFGISRYIGGAQKIWNQGIQTRVDVTASMLGSMKAVKMLGFTGKLTEILQGLRVKELKLAAHFRRLFCAGIFFNNSIRTVAPLATFVVFVIVSKSNGQRLMTATAFTTLSLLELLSSPLNTFLRAIQLIYSALACFGRIQSFLAADTLQHHVLPLSDSSNSSIKEVRRATESESDNATSIELQYLSTNFASRSAAMIVRNASFSWGNNRAPAVNDVSFSIHRGDIVFVIGPVGCGKSTLLKSLMSETPSSQGFVYSSISEIAFVDQTPWVQNVTIQQNVVGPSILNQAWYDEVIHACALDYDISSMPKRDETLVGSQGFSLSGGQKQRLALARALYSKKDLMIIDDAFSGLDVETEESLFVELFEKRGIIKRLGMTVIFATHAIHRVSYADHIIALDSTGHISEQGSFEELTHAGGYVESLAAKHKHDGKLPKMETKSNKLFNDPTEEVFTAGGAIHSKEDDTVRSKGELSTYKYYFASVGWARSLLSISLLLSAGTLSKATELLLSYWTSSVAKHGNEVNDFFMGIYGMLAGLLIITFIWAVYHSFLHFIPGSAETLHARLLQAVMGAPLHFFASTDTGTTTNRFSQDMSVVDGELAFSLIDLLFSGAQTVMSAILICLSAGYFTLTIPPVVLVVYLIQKYYLRTSRQIRILDLEAKSPLYSHFIESLSGLITIRAFGWSDTFVHQNLVLLDNSQKPYYLLWCIQRWLGLVLDLMVSGLALILMILIVKLRSSISPGYVGLALLNVMGFSQSLTQNVRMWTAMETSIGAVARLKTFAEVTPNENLPRETQEVAEDWPASGQIELRNLSASYTPSGNSIIKGINMTIKPGQKIGICGRSGSGKSSLIMTLFRMLEIPPESSILIDGTDITTIQRQVVRSRLNAIPQDPFFMKGSIRLNASPENLHSDQEIVTALEKVQLWSIIESKGGLDADLHADFFSHGQRQLFCLARAILRKSKIVVLDEVSSSVDVTTDKLMQSFIREEFADATIVAIAHRLDTILDFDKVAVLSKGRLVEFDSPMALLGRRSAFRDLYYS